MATKKSPKTRVKNQVDEVLASEVEFTNTLNNQSDNSGKKFKVPSWAIALVVVALSVIFWWWKTNTWPVVAIVDGKIITRYEVEKELFAQSGQTVIESLITQKQIESELDKQKIKVDSKEIDSKIEEIKKTMPEGVTLEQELKDRGLDMNKFKNLLSIQLRLTKASEAKATVSGVEIDKYVKDNGTYLSGKTDAEKRSEAEEILKQDKLNDAITLWVEEAKKNGNVWRLWPLPTPIAAPTTPPIPTPTPGK